MVKRVEIDHKGLPFLDEKGVYVFFEDYAILKAERDALAAENAGLKSAMSVTLEHVSVTDKGQAGVAAMIINDELHNSETPATDAFLAEVRAQGVEALADHLAGMNISVSETSVRDFAAQLRQEAK